MPGTKNLFGPKSLFLILDAIFGDGTLSKSGHKFDPQKSFGPKICPSKKFWPKIWALGQLFQKFYYIKIQKNSKFQQELTQEPKFKPGTNTGTK